MDVSVIHSLARNTLINLIEKCSGTKLIVWESSISGPMGLIAQYSLLKEMGVIKMYPLRTGPLLENPAEHVIFISRPKLHSMDLIAENVHESKKTSGNSKQYHLFFLTRNSLLCKKRLENRGMLGSLTYIEELNCEFFPVDSDLISMEIPEVFGEYHIQNDPTTLYKIAQAIITLQKIYGPIPRVWGKGQAAKQVWDLVKRLQRENNLEETFKNNQTTSIDQILLIDRSIDLITPLATQLTYEGLIDEIFGLNNTTACFPADKFKNKTDRVSESLAEAKETVILDSADALFTDLRDKNFNAVGAFLSKQAKLISAQLEERHEISVQEMKVFVQKLPNILANKNALSRHTAIAESIKDVTDSFDFLDSLQVEQEFLNCIEVDKANGYIEDLLAQKAPMIKVLRLICLQCLTGSGLKPKLLEYYKRELVQVYGIEALLALNNLEKVGLLKVQTGSRQYAVLRKTMRLTVEDTSEINPIDISYVHSIYAPLSIRIAEQLMKNGGWKQLQDVLGLLPGPNDEDTSNIYNGAISNSALNDAPTVVLVFFIGGCTFAEISALRFLSQQENSNVEFVVATTKLINGNTFLQSIIDIDNKKTVSHGI